MGDLITWGAPKWPPKPPTLRGDRAGARSFHRTTVLNTLITEPSHAEVANVDAGGGAGEHLGDHLSRGRRVLEAVAAEADGEIEAAHARRPVENGVLVRRQRPQAGPGVTN